MKGTTLNTTISNRSHCNKCTHMLSRFVIISMLQMSKLRLRGERRKDLSLSIRLQVSRQILQCPIYAHTSFKVLWEDPTKGTVYGNGVTLRLRAPRKGQRPSCYSSFSTRHCQQKEQSLQSKWGVHSR